MSSSGHFHPFNPLTASIAQLFASVSFLIVNGRVFHESII